MFYYQYIGKVPIDLPTVGKRNIQPNDVIKSAVEINNSLFQVTDGQKHQEIAQEIQQEENKINELKQEEKEGEE